MYLYQLPLEHPILFVVFSSSWIRMPVGHEFPVDKQG